MKFRKYSRLYPIIFLIIASTLIAIGASKQRYNVTTEITSTSLEITTSTTEITTEETTQAPTTTNPPTTQRPAATQRTITSQKGTQVIVQDHSTSQYYTDQDAVDLAKVLWKECGGINSKTEQACVAWTVLNWVDIDGISVQKEVRKPGRFAFYESTRVDKDMLELAYDVLNRWSAEKDGVADVGRVLPRDYLYFEGHGGHNHFRNAFKGNYTVWDYSLPSPYDS